MSISSSSQAAHQALNASVVALNNFVLGRLPVHWPNQVFTPPSGGLYFTVDKIPDAVVVRTLGPTGEDEHRGILQLSFYAPAGDGEKKLLELYDKVRTFYTAGAHARYKGAGVLIEDVSTTPPAIVGGRWCAFFSVQWMTRIPRNLSGSTQYLANLDSLVGS